MTLNRSKNTWNNVYRKEALLCMSNVYLCLVLLSQSWGVCVRGVSHRHIDIVWLYLQKENRKIHSTICHKHITMVILLHILLYTKGL